MIRSMTAFARDSRGTEAGTLTWELRSLNHRYLEVSVRLPDDLRSLETAVRERVAKVLGRGKVECSLRFQRGPASPLGMALDGARARRLVELFDEVRGLSSNTAPLDVMALLRWPGIVEDTGPDLGSLTEQVLELLDVVLAELATTREREGARLKTLIEQRCAEMQSGVVQVRDQMPAIRTALRERLENRLAELNVEAEPGRLEQELAMQLQKIDVDEELDRLQAHLQEIGSVMERDEPVGRRLDFLMQELNREANTLGSKSAAVETSRASVELKVLIEQMREQVQNIE